MCYGFATQFFSCIHLPNSESFRYHCLFVVENSVISIFSDPNTYTVHISTILATCPSVRLIHWRQRGSAMDMDNLLGGGGGGAAGQFPLEQWFYEMPVCTRWWTAATVATSLLVQCHIITPFQLFYSFRAVFIKNQVSRSLRISSPLPLISPNALSLTFALQ